MNDPKDVETTDQQAIETTGQNRPAELSDEELRAQGGEELPDREAMSLVNANVAAPVNLAAALNVLSDHSTAVAAAQQSNDIQQTAK